MQMGTVSAGPFQIAEHRLCELIERVMDKPASVERVH
jgi:hypothetical protein